MNQNQPTRISPTPSTIASGHRRRSMNAMATNYPAALSMALCNAKIDDGTRVPGANGLQVMIRDYLPGELRTSAVSHAAQFFINLLRLRIQIELDADVDADNLVVWHALAVERLKTFREVFLGKGVVNVATPEEVAPLTNFENLMARTIFDAMRLDFQADPMLNETQFWADVFLGMADADPTAVVGDAARLVFLDHRDTFEAAHTADVRAQCTGMTRQ